MSDPEDRAGRSRTRLEEAWRDSLRAAESDTAGPDDAAAYVDGLLDGEARDLFEERMAADEVLRQEVRDLEELRDALATGRRPASFRFIGAGLAAAAALLLGVVLVGRPPDERRDARLPPAAEAPRPADRLTLRDGPREVAVAADGSLRGLEDVEVRLRGLVTEALQTGVLRSPPAVALLQGTSGTLMGTTDAAEFSVLSPVATAVRTDRPRFAWRAHPRASRYRVTVVDEDLRVVARSSELLVAAWTPPAALARKKTYEWQVAALTGGGREVAPAPGQPRALFSVLSAEQAGELERALAATAGSRLAAAVLLAERGVLDEADGVLAELASQNAHGTVIETLRSSLRVRQVSFRR